MRISDAVERLDSAPKQRKTRGAKTPEGKVKQRVKEILDELDCYWFMPVTTGYSRGGVPDFIACVNGRFVGIETKSIHSSHTLTKLQEINLKQIETAGGVSLVINEQNVEDLSRLLKGENV